MVGEGTGALVGEGAGALVGEGTGALVGEGTGAAQLVALQTNLLSIPHPVVQHVLPMSSSLSHSRCPRCAHSATASAYVAALLSLMKVGLQTDPAHVSGWPILQQRMAFR